eukprot:GHVT01069357.1.p1 GENE.GHVT01069357.1~~GHVT01069357.1.p1  ORF type:complete len:784 (-),score=175.28 GHVT01069357.1:192-2543(-)
MHLLRFKVSLRWPVPFRYVGLLLTCLFVKTVLRFCCAPDAGVRTVLAIGHHERVVERYRIYRRRERDDREGEHGENSQVAVVDVEYPNEMARSFDSTLPGISVNIQTSEGSIAITPGRPHPHPGNGDPSGDAALKKPLPGGIDGEKSVELRLGQPQRGAAGSPDEKMSATSSTTNPVAEKLDILAEVIIPNDSNARKETNHAIPIQPSVRAPPSDSSPIIRGDPTSSSFSSSSSSSPSSSPSSSSSSSSSSSEFGVDGVGVSEGQKKIPLSVFEAAASEEAATVALNELRDRLVTMPPPLIPSEGTGSAKEPQIPRGEYPWEIRCPTGWLPAGPHCLTVVAVEGYTECPGDKQQFRKGLKKLMAVGQPGICATTETTGLVFKCPPGFSLETRDSVAAGASEGELASRAFVCRGVETIPFEFMNGRSCQLGYRPSAGGCVATQELPPSSTCPPNFQLGGEQINAYAFRGKEYAKCGRVKFYKGKVWCPNGFVPFRTTFPEIAFGSVIVEDNDSPAARRRLDENEGQRDAADARSRPNKNTTKPTRKTQQLPHPKPAHQEGEKQHAEEQGAQLEEEKQLGAKRQQEEQQPQVGSIENLLRSEVVEFKASVSSVAWSEASNDSDRGVGTLYLEENIKLGDGVEQDQVVELALESGMETSKIETSGSVFSQSWAEEEVEEQVAQMTGETSGNDEEKQAGEPRKLQLGGKTRLSIYADLAASLSVAPKCLQVVSTFFSNCDTYTCRSPYISQVERRLRNWIYYKLDGDPDLVRALIPNGRNIRNTERT